ncbi:MAG: LLM class flavin-dependent oxidoreductase [Thermoleophilia bacterium]
MRPLQVGAYAGVRPPLDVALAGVRASEAAGFDAVWWSDHFLHWFPPGVWTPDVSPMAAAVRSPHAFLDPTVVMGAAAATTERIRLGTAVTDPVRRHPAVLAQTFLTLDHLSQGRAILGIGVGEAENILPYGLPYDRRASRLIEALEVIRLLWGTIDPVSYRGEHFTLDDAILGAEPYGDAPPPIWVAAHRPRTLEATGRLADGWLPIVTDPGAYAAALGRIRDASVAAGRPRDRVTAGLYAWIVVDEDRETARRMLQSTLMRFVALTAPAEDFRRAGAEPPIAQGWGLVHYVPTRVGREEGLRMAAAVPDALLESYVMWGTPDDIVERLTPFRAAGLEHVYLANVSALGDPARAASSAALLVDILAGLRRLP